METYSFGCYCFHCLGWWKRSTLEFSICGNMHRITTQQIFCTTWFVGAKKGTGIFNSSCWVRILKQLSNCISIHSVWLGVSCLLRCRNILHSVHHFTVFNEPKSIQKGKKSVTIWILKEDEAVHALTLTYGLLYTLCIMPTTHIIVIIGRFTK